METESIKTNENGVGKMISVIVPVYNVEKYLNECIESILKQTYVDLQVILVNDGSSDKSPLICDKFALRDSRIEVIHQKNAGVSSARNAGLRVAKGEFIAFVDGDDSIHPKHFENLITQMGDLNIKMAVCGYAICDTHGNILFKSSDILENRYLEPTNALGKFFTSQFHGSCWNKLYKKDVIVDSGLVFDERISYCEDLLFNIQYLNSLPLNEKVVSFTTFPTYYYLKSAENSNTLTSSMVTIKTTTRLLAIECMLSIPIVKKCGFVVRDLKHSYVENTYLYSKKLSNWEEKNYSKKRARKYLVTYFYTSVVKKYTLKSIVATIVHIIF